MKKATWYEILIWFVAGFAFNGIAELVMLAIEGNARYANEDHEWNGLKVVSNSFAIAFGCLAQLATLLTVFVG